MLNTNGNTYNDILRFHSKTMMVQDGRTLVDLLLNTHDSAVSLSLIPFCALYCRSAKEFLRVEDIGDDIEKEVKDIRDGLKIFSGRYSKGREMASESDDQQNEIFQSKLSFSFLKSLNIHLNLGVYFDQQGHVVFNTQLANFYLNIPKTKENSTQNHAMVVGEKLGSEIAEILVNYCGVNDLMSKKAILNSVPKYGYVDFNTNRKNGFFNIGFDKETNLILLHMLSIIGFVNNLLVPVLLEKNLWLLRIVYITAHNTWLGIKKISQHLEQNHQSGAKSLELTRRFNGDIKLFSSSFRNCMMHYDLVDKNDCPVVLQERYDPNKPLYGLVESCYDGMQFDQYYDKLFILSQEIEEYLLTCFTINKKSICWDWN